MRLIIASLFLVGVVGCGGRNAVQCELDSHCDLRGGGRCVAGGGGMWCAYPDPECPEGFRYSEQSELAGVCVQGLTDAGVDAPDSQPLIDALPGQNRFDVAYVDDWRLGTSTTSMNVTGWLRVVNLGAQPLNVAEMTVTNVTDDHPGMVVEITIHNAGTMSLPPGFTEGRLDGGAYSLVLEKMNETAQEPTVSLLRISIDPVAPSGTWLVMNATATLTIGNAYVILPMRIASSGGGSAATPYTARRVSSTPL